MAVTTRRSPTQERSQETVQRIFDATARLLGRLALAELTTSVIAQEAGVSVGALYRFFPDKQSIVDAIAVNHVTGFSADVFRRLHELTGADGRTLFAAVIDTYVEYLEAHADFRAIAFGHHISAQTRIQQSEPDAVAAGLVKSFLIGLGMKDTPELDLKLRIATQTGERLIAFAYEQPDAARRAQVIAEMKRLLSDYLFA